MSISGIKPTLNPAPSGVQNGRDDINKMIEKMREMANKQTPGVTQTEAVKPNDFSNILTQVSNSVENVNNLQMQSKGLKEAYVSGDKNVSISQVVMASQESGLAFQALLSARNKLLEAYKEVMNMPV